VKATWLIPVYLLAMSCGPARPPVSPGLASCPAACDNLRNMQCPWAADTPAGATCEQRCENRERSGYDTGHPECVAIATSCEQADGFSASGCD
jgi:hypothetical protein